MVRYLPPKTSLRAIISVLMSAAPCLFPTGLASGSTMVPTRLRSAGLAAPMETSSQATSHTALQFMRHLATPFKATTSARMQPEAPRLATGTREYSFIIPVQHSLVELLVDQAILSLPTPMVLIL